MPFALLLEITGLPADELRSALYDLQAAKFVYEASLYPDLENTFKHALTHDVAYGSLLQERLAHRAVRGEVRDKAVDYLRGPELRAFNRFELLDRIDALALSPRFHRYRHFGEPAPDGRFRANRLARPKVCNWPVSDVQS